MDAVLSQKDDTGNMKPGNSIQQDLMKSKESNQLENGYIGNT